MARAIWYPAALGPLLAACTLGQPIQSVQEVPAPPDTVAERVAAGFVRLGLDRPSDEGERKLSANLGHVRTNWANCPPRFVGAGDDRRIMATAGRRHGNVEVTLAPVPAGTRVEVHTRYVGVYRNYATGYTFETPCNSTGVVENELVAAAAGEG